MHAEVVSCLRYLKYRKPSIETNVQHIRQNRKVSRRDFRLGAFCHHVVRTVSLNFALALTNPTELTVSTNVLPPIFQTLPSLKSFSLRRGQPIRKVSSVREHNTTNFLDFQHRYPIHIHELSVYLCLMFSALPQLFGIVATATMDPTILPMMLIAHNVISNAVRFAG